MRSPASVLFIAFALGSVSAHSQTYSRLRTVDVGCATHDVLTMEINLPRGTYQTGTQIVSFYEQLSDRIRQLPGVRGVTVGTILPGQGHQRHDVFTIREHPPLPKGQVLSASTVFVDPSYFSALQIPLLQGRVLQPDERLDHSHSVIVNQTFVRQFLSGFSLNWNWDTDLWPYSFQETGKWRDRAPTLRFVNSVVHSLI